MYRSRVPSDVLNELTAIAAAEWLSPRFSIPEPKTQPRERAETAAPKLVAWPQAVWARAAPAGLRTLVPDDDVAPNDRPEGERKGGGASHGGSIGLDRVLDL